MDRFSALSFTPMPASPWQAATGKMAHRQRRSEYRAGLRFPRACVPACRLQEGIPHQARLLPATGARNQGQQSSGRYAVSPAHPATKPAMATTLAVIKVAQKMTTSRSRPASTPSAFASSSPRDRTLIRQRNRNSGTRPNRTAGTAGRISPAFTPARLPSNQKVIAGSWS